MAGSIANQGISAPQAAPGFPSSIAQLLEDFPELHDDLAACNAWRDVGSFDRRSKDYYKQFPSTKPRVP